MDSLVFLTILLEITLYKKETLVLVKDPHNNSFTYSKKMKSNGHASTRRSSKVTHCFKQNRMSHPNREARSCRSKKHWKNVTTDNPPENRKVSIAEKPL